jgi:hypothetical protein
VRQLRLVLAVTLVLAGALCLRTLAVAGVAPLPKLSGAALVIGVALAVWEFALLGAALLKVSRRRQLRRRHYRTPTEVVGVMDNVIVRVVDLTPDGAGLRSPHWVTPGREVDLLLELPMVDQRMRATRLRLTVTACRPDDEGPRSWRIGGTVTARHTGDRDALVEYCHVVAARTRLSESGRVLPVAVGSGQGEERVTAVPLHDLTKSVASGS